MISSRRETSPIETAIPGRRIYLAGASGVIGSRLVPLLVDAGYTVGAMTRSSAKAARLASLGAEPIVCDVFDRGASRRPSARFRPTWSCMS
jgi:nucleoside-diphosphate-sugar epimerase